MADLFTYDDYRLFLKDWWVEARKRRGFSLKVFAQRAGLGSQGHLKMVIDGKRNLGLSGLERFMDGMRLMGCDRLYFRYLVLMNQATSDLERVKFHSRLLLLKKYWQRWPEVFERAQEGLRSLKRELCNHLTPHLQSEDTMTKTHQELVNDFFDVAAMFHTVK